MAKENTSTALSKKEQAESLGQIALWRRTNKQIANLRGSLDRIAGNVDELYGERSGQRIRGIVRVVSQNLTFSVRHLVDPKFSDDPALRGEAYMRILDVLDTEVALLSEIAEIGHERGFGLRSRVPELLPEHKVKAPKWFPHALAFLARAVAKEKGAGVLEEWEILHRTVLFSMGRLDEFLEHPGVIGFASAVDDRFRKILNPKEVAVSEAKATKKAAPAKKTAAKGAAAKPKAKAKTAPKGR